MRKSMAPSQSREQRPEKEGGRPARTAARKAMEFLPFARRVLFTSIFLLSAYQDASQFGSDGGPAIKFLEPKFNLFVNQVSTNIGMVVPHVQMVFFTTLFLRVSGAIMLIHYSSFGAFLLIAYLAFITPVMYDFYNYEIGSLQFVQLFTQFSQNMALCGALLFFMGMKNSIPRRHPGMEFSIPRRHSKKRMGKTKTT